MKKKYFRFNEANQPDEEVTAKQAARIRQRQARSERLAEKIRQALEAA